MAQNDSKIPQKWHKHGNEKKSNRNVWCSFMRKNFLLYARIMHGGKKHYQKEYGQNHLTCGRISCANSFFLKNMWNCSPHSLLKSYGWLSRNRRLKLASSIRFSRHISINFECFENTKTNPARGIPGAVRRPNTLRYWYQ